MYRVLATWTVIVQNKEVKARVVLVTLIGTLPCLGEGEDSCFVL
jgi:hypothetical protein